MDELLVKLKTKKSEMEKKGLLVNIGKTKSMVSGKDPCGVCKTVCQTVVGSNANLWLLLLDT